MKSISEITQAIQNGKTALGIELGSTQVKAVLIGPDFEVLASGSNVWENKYENHIWTYSEEDIWNGVQKSYAQLAAQVFSSYHVSLEKVGSIGVSAMMHGYLAFDKNQKLLTPFRTWRNNITRQAAEELTELFNFNIPQRWSIAHLYQAILNGEEHVAQIDYLTTLAGYVHWKLSGERVLGVGDASGMFPIDNRQGYRQDLLTKFSNQKNVKAYSWEIEDILPEVKVAGQMAGSLTSEGAKLLDPTGNLQAGSLMAPPEGDAGTGMISTNSVRKKTGNISVGTSAFAMVVLEKELQSVHRDIDVVTTPDGEAVAMVHANNCSSDINAWAGLFKEFASRLGINVSGDTLYETLFLDALKSQPDAGGLVNYSYLSGENITDVQAGRPLFVRTPNSHFTLANFMVSQLYAAFAPLQIGMETLTKEEGIQTEVMIAQGGLFKTPVVGQQILANALDLPITIMNNASVGGPWGMAVLALYLTDKDELSLPDYLDTKVFTQSKSMTLAPEEAGVAGYRIFIENYQAGLEVERLAEKINYEG